EMFRGQLTRVLLASSFLLFLWSCSRLFSDNLTSFNFLTKVMGNTPITVESTIKKEVKSAEVHIAIAVCQSNLIKGKGFAEDDRQYRQIRVMFKSAAVLTSTVVRYSIITDSEEVYNQLTNIPSDWPAEYQTRLTFAPRRNLYNPPELGNLRDVFRPCASERLFLAQSFVDEDAVIYTDSDSYFMQPPEHLWDLFRNFDIRQVAGVTPHLYHYTPPFNK
ncbi:hypothetical protein SK128_019725, partial [Halocaridina rubra]